MMNLKDSILVHSNERVDDLERKGYQIIQNPEVFCFGIDAVLLSHFAKVSKDAQKILDIGTGTGVIPTLMYATYEKGYYTAIDIQKQMVEMANRSVQLNDLQKRITILEQDIKTVKQKFNGNSFDIITCNPPYMKQVAGLKNEHPSKMIARHEIACTLEDIITSSKYLLKDKGKFYMVHRPQRLVDIIAGMRNAKIEPKKLRFVHPKQDKEPTMVLIEGVKNGNSEMRIAPPLVIYNNDDTYTKEIYEIYGMGEKQ